MTIKVVPAVYEDMGAMSTIEQESYSSYPLEGLLFKHSEEGSDLFEKQNEHKIKQWKENPTVLYLKAIDTAANDDIIAFAMYNLYDKDKVHLIHYPTGDDVPQMLGEAANLQPASEFFGDLWAGRERCIGKRPHILLEKLNTAPQHQRRGAGSMLIQKGCDVADELGIVAGLEATPQGLPLYKRHGYMEVETIVFHPQKYGKDVEPFKTVCMLRQPGA